MFCLAKPAFKKGTREMNNEPVAWMMENPQNKSAYLTFEKPTREMKISHQAIPLYTHPAKILTDGIDLLEKYADKLEDERPNKGFFDVVYECIAILRKAQEK